MESHTSSPSVISRQDTETRLNVYLVYALQDMNFVELNALVLGT